MSVRNSSSYYKLRSLITFLHRYRVYSGHSSLSGRHDEVLSSNLRHSWSMHQGLRLISTNSRVGETSKTDMLKDDRVKVQSAAPVHSSYNFPTWAKWLLFSMLSLLLPLGHQKWGKWLTLEGKVENAIEEVEVVAEVVEKVATVVEKVSAEVADELADNSKLKEAALMVEHGSSVAAKDAQLTIDFIHKAENLKVDLKDLETMVEPVIKKIIEGENGEK
ncbi:unnamed protein product [Ilex paraguariensis]|uniref:Uncharacterized protein n=1 Tax=Ilex paraguariensis TaxID=185542 RepID=A0ABC8T4Y2_9AQUA